MVRLLFIIGMTWVPLIAGAQTGPVDLSQEEYVSIDTFQDDSPAKSDHHVLSAPWWRNFEIHGFGAVGLYDTGRNGSRPHGGFEIKEASLFIHADVWKNTEMFIELQTNWLDYDMASPRTGEVYVHFRDLFESGSLRAGLKAGRIDIPFGEEYLWQDAIDNPMISMSAAYVYGRDEGVVAYGQFGQLSFVASITDGTDARSAEDHDDKAVNFKLYGNPIRDLYLSFSAMRNGSAAKSAVEFGGSHFQPIGASHSSTLGDSSSEMVDSSLFQLDAKYQLSERNYISAHVGWARQDDDDSSFDRDITWFGVEPYFQFNPRWYAVARYSEIGTYDSNEGFHFDGKSLAKGNRSFGYDTKRFQRLGFAVGYQPNPRVRVKLEIGKDWFELVDSSPFGPSTDKREYAALELAVGF